MNITNSDRLVFPEIGVTKKDVLNYYMKVHSFMKTHLSDRKVVVKRFTKDVTSEGFFQRGASPYMPNSLKGQGGHLVCNDKESLGYLVNHNAIEYYVGLNKVGNLTNPDKLVIDLDPVKGDFNPAKLAAKELKIMLDKINLDSYLMTTGSKGLHIVIPVFEKISWMEGREFVKVICGILNLNSGDKYTLNPRVSARKGKMFLDYTINAGGKVTVCPMSLRASDKGSIAMPIDWDMLNKSFLKGDYFNLKNYSKYLASGISAWSSFYTSRNDINKSKSRLNSIIEEKQFSSYSGRKLMKGADGVAFDEGFRPSYTPIEMLKMGVFGGAYFSDSKLNVGTPPAILGMSKDLWGRSEPDPKINHYGISAGSDLAFWTEKKLIHKDDPAGWFHWYMKYFYGRRHEDDRRQIGRWRSFVARHGAQAYGKVGRERQKQALLQWAWDVKIDPKSLKK